MAVNLLGLLKNPIAPIKETGTRGTEEVQGVNRRTWAQPLTTGYDVYAQYDNKYNNGHNGAMQRVFGAGYDGYANPRWMA